VIHNALAGRTALCSGSQDRVRHARYVFAALSRFHKVYLVFSIVSSQALVHLTRGMLLSYVWLGSSDQFLVPNCPSCGESDSYSVGLRLR
jgi:hypothetical protein